MITAAIVRDNTPKIATDDLPANTTLLDTRTKEEFAISHLPNAQWIGNNEVPLDSLVIKKDAPIILYCSIGYRSGLVGEQLIEQGFKEVYNLDGGLFQWFNEGKAVLRNRKRTRDVHPYSRFWGLWLEDANRIKTVPRKITIPKISR